MKTISNPTYVLRTCDNDLQGYVEALDWDPECICGGGLHGLLMGKGSPHLLDWDDEAIWQVVEVQEDTVVWIDEDQVKFPYGNVIYSGNRKDATDLLISLGADPKDVPGSFQIGGDRSALYGGDFSTVQGGDFSTLYGGDSSTVHGGDYSTLTGWDFSTLTGGRGSTLTGRDWSNLTGGDGSILHSGYWSKFKAGKNSCFIGSYWENGRKRFITAYVGEDGIKADTWYLFENDAFTEVVNK